MTNAIAFVDRMSSKRYNYISILYSFKTKINIIFYNRVNKNRDQSEEEGKERDWNRVTRLAHSAYRASQIQSHKLLPLMF